ncbi:DUF502 domain-containing protein [Siculibacillus lacustris]|uniref:DUF502 domain-containing protein n=1 Tax=Siculibacillus lacustris TaxID=1549641 RepID=A0A4Q9VMW4_9HYPH|nr:DUF502 domain-containing protein [Siculibacillus lacustris]TBW36972.1 DUF502 domain-containing protein [Siculibacillus lacustris]
MSDKKETVPLRQGWGARIRNHFVTGVVVAGPLAITVYIARGFLEWVDGTVKPMIPTAWNPDTYLPFGVPGFGLFVALVGITLLGALTASLVGRTLLSYGEDLVGHLPFVRPVYKTLKQIFETFVSSRHDSFRDVGLIEWPRRGVWSLVFVSGPARGEVAQRLSAERPDVAPDAWLTVFIPTTPNPTGGYVMFLPRDDVRILRMAIEDAAKLIISGGIVTPDWEPPPAVEVPDRFDHPT